MKLVNIVGARPQFIKLGPILRAIAQYNSDQADSVIQEILVHTGQHYDYEMSKVFFDELELKEPDYHLGVGSGTHAYQTGEMLKAIEEVLLKEKPALVMVYGDTNSTLAGALAAAKLHVPVAHVEAGLRSFNKFMPEEINRVLTDHVSELLFCPTEAAVKNLANESITRGVHHVGDVMHDALCDNIGIAERKSMILNQLNLRPKEYFLATVHRAENTDQVGRLNRIVSAFVELAESGRAVVFPVHPRTRKLLHRSGTIAHRKLLMIDPVSYLDMLMLEKHAKAILTDSGGVQKEAYWFGVPSVTLREETEWVETVESGWNRLAGADAEWVVALAGQAWGGAPSTASPSPVGAAKRICEIIRKG